MNDYMQNWCEDYYFEEIEMTCQMMKDQPMAPFTIFTEFADGWEFSCQDESEEWIKHWAEKAHEDALMYHRMVIIRWTSTEYTNGPQLIWRNF
jgi:hypothetical protein